MNELVILHKNHFMRGVCEVDNEEIILKKYFNSVNKPLKCKNQLVIGRYSVVPDYEKIEVQLNLNGCKLINTFSQHSYIANFDWYEDVKDFTPKTYFNIKDLPDDEYRKYILKGRTKSRKENWNDLFFANSRIKAIEIYKALIDDEYVSDQGIIIRDFVSLNILEKSEIGILYANEHRFFFYKENMLTNFFYWKSCCKTLGELDDKGIKLANDIAKIISKKVNFFVLDIAQKENGEWILIEINDGQMSGIFSRDIKSLDELYYSLKNYLALEYGN